MQIEQTQNILCELCGTNHVFSDSAVFTFCDDCSNEVEALGIEEEDIISTGKADEEE
jgi:ribosome-binding protein aMBF1 (putative translation factor)